MRASTPDRGRGSRSPRRPRGLLPCIAAPTLVLHGERDVFFPPSHAAVLAKRIPDARLITIPELGHGLPIEFFAPYRDKIIANFERAGRPRGERAEPAECRIPSAS